MEKEGNVFKAAINLSKPEFQNIFKREAFILRIQVFGANYEYTENWTPGSKEGFKSKLTIQTIASTQTKLAYDPYSKELSHLHFRCI